MENHSQSGSEWHSSKRNNSGMGIGQGSLFGHLFDILGYRDFKTAVSCADDLVLMVDHSKKLVVKVTLSSELQRRCDW